MAQAKDLPRSIANAYFRQVRGLIEEDRKRVWEAFDKEIRALIHEYRGMTANRIRVNDPLDRIRDILDRLRESTEQTFNESKVTRLARRFVENLNDHNKNSLQQQVESVLGIDPLTTEPWLRSFMETAVKDNVNYISTIANDYHDKIETVVMQGARRGESLNEMAKQISERGKVSKNRARFIARDQLGSVYGDLTKKRQEEMGLTKFRWRTSRDERVRDSHENLHDKVFTWKDGANGLYPGNDYNCRCVAETLDEELFKVEE